MKKILIFLILCFFSGISFGQNKKSEQLKNNKIQLEKEIAKTNDLLNQTKKSKDATIKQLAVLKKQILNREALITNLNEELIQLESELDKNIKLSQSLDRKLEYMKADYSRIVYSAYKNRKWLDKLTFILSSDDFIQMYRKFKYYILFADEVQIKVNEIRKTKENIETKKIEIEQLKSNKIALLENKEIEIKNLEKDKNDKTKTSEELKKKEALLVQELNSKKQKRSEIDVAIKKAIQEEIAATNAKKAQVARDNKVDYTKTEKTIQKKEETKKDVEITLTPEEMTLNNSFVSNKGKLPWPVSKGIKIGEYGNYPHPEALSVMVNNKGIDILSENGTEIRAVFDGEVTGVLNILGTKVLMIRHGEYLTVYQNVSNIAVRKGDKVKTKQKIGNLVKTDNSLPELHFEVWKNSVNLDPNQWLAHQ